MRSLATVSIVCICFAALFLLCYASALFLDRQFGYRDAGHFYYPLYQRVQEEWKEGRWPLWEREENSGFPLLGNPTAAVFYPGKLIYAVLPYPSAARIYIAAHSALAFFAMLILMRSWGTSWAGAGLSGLAFAFGAPILFQHSNIIYLVGAAWLPLGVRALDRWLRLGRYSGVLELAIVLAMQVLGGDPQAAYLLGLSGGAYALLLNSGFRPVESAETTDGAIARGSGWWIALILVAGVAIYSAVVLFLAEWLPMLRAKGGPPTPPLWWMAWVPAIVLGAWALVGVLFVFAWWRRGWRYPLGVMWLGLVASAALAIALSAVQLLPIVEFAQRTVRSGGWATRHLSV